MPPYPYLKWRFAYWEKFHDRKTWIEYLQPMSIDVSELGEIFTKAHPGVIQLIEDHAKAYMVDGLEPPPAIAGAVLNFVDQVAAGQVPVMRTGDYLAARNFMKQSH